MGLGAKRRRLERFDRKAMLELEGALETDSDEAVFWRRDEGVASPKNIRASSRHWRAWVQ
jgi:hypothetical protein